MNTRLTRKRAKTGIAVLAIAATGAVWAGCGDDAEDEANEAIDAAQEQVDESRTSPGARRPTRSPEAGGRGRPGFCEGGRRRGPERRHRGRGGGRQRGGRGSDRRGQRGRRPSSGRDRRGPAVSQGTVLTPRASAAGAPRSDRRRDLDLAPVATRVADLDPPRHPHPVALERLGADLGPLDERDRVGGQVVVEQPRLLGAEPAEAVEVEVRDRGDASPACSAGRP